MKIFLAATSDKQFIKNIKDSKYILESYYYFQEWQVPLIKSCDMFLLDSGAFTFMATGKKVDWKKYTDDYINFINKYDIDYFFELDIDCIIGYDNVKKIRAYIEEKTGKKCIPVWHYQRGKQEFVNMCKQYKYVAFGGLNTDGIDRKKIVKYMPWFIETAHKYGAKIHGLGFTSIKDLPQLKFDSVDSTSWKSGGRFGQLHIYKNGKLETITQKSKRAIYKKIDEHNFNEWLKYQRYAERNL